ncbi:hypothetical protein HDK77DRAFT_487816 [Phyllosticta capitalensis]
MDRVGSGAIVEIVAEFLIATATTIWRTSLGLRSAKGLLFDDILAIIATCLWWVGSAIFAFTGSHYRLSNANLTESQRLDIHHGSLQDTAHDAMMGSIMFFIGWEVTIIFIWTLKLSVLYNFASLMGKVPGMTRPLQCATVFWAASLSGVVLYHHLKCLPVQKNWQIFPDPGNACQPALATLSQYLLNLSDATMDIVFIIIALDFVRRAGTFVTMKHRLIHSALFSAGFLVVGLEAGILYEVHTGIPGAAGMWRVRRTSLQIIITNLPSLYPSILKASRSIRDHLRAITQKPKPHQTATDSAQVPQAEGDIEMGAPEGIANAEPSSSCASSTANLLPQNKPAALFDLVVHVLGYNS